MAKEDALPASLVEYHFYGTGDFHQPRRSCGALTRVRSGRLVTLFEEVS